MLLELTLNSHGQFRRDKFDAEWEYHPYSARNGGFIATLLDSVCGCAAQTTLPAGTAYTSLDLSVSFLRGLTSETGRVVAHGRVTKPGSRAAFVEADLREANGQLLPSQAW